VRRATDTTSGISFKIFSAAKPTLLDSFRDAPGGKRKLTVKVPSLKGGRNPRPMKGILARVMLRRTKQGRIAFLG